MLLLSTCLLGATHGLAAAEKSAVVVDRLLQLSEIETRAFQRHLSEEDLGILTAASQEPQAALSARAVAISANIMTGLARQYILALQTLAGRRISPSEVKALVDAARAASPEGATTGLASLDLGAVAGVLEQDADGISIEVAHWYMAVGRADLAAPLITAASRSTDAIIPIRAAELGADLLAKQRRFGDAIPGYEYAQALIHRLHQDAGGYELKVNWHGEDEVLALRVDAKLKEARRLWDLDRYGPAYVAFREGEALRVTAGDVVAALVKHQRLQIEQAGSIFASASRSAVVKCLISLAACPDKTLPASPYREYAKQHVLELRVAATTLILVHAVPGAVTEIKAAIDQQEDELRRLARAPSGPQAISSALEIVQKVAAREQDDPYLGEMFYDIGRDELERTGTLEDAQVWFARAIGWCHRTAGNRGVSADLGLSAATSQVSAPPPRERTPDGWGNRTWQEPKVGDLFNPLTCAWYLVWLERNARVYDGLGHFAIGEYDAARVRWSTLPQIDPTLGADEAAGRGSLFNHLMWDVEHNDGALYASPEEMAQFVKPTLRMAVFLADLDYEAERPERALKRYRAIVDNTSWTLSENQGAYLQYAIASCLHYTHQTEAALAILDGFQDGYRHAPSRPRALYGLGNLSLRTPSAQGELKAEAVFSRLLADHPDHLLAAAGAYVMGWYYDVTGKPRDSARWLRLYLERFPAGPSAAVARTRLAALIVTKP